MEDVLEVYTRPDDPRYPQVCMDEVSKQLLRDTRKSLPIEPGKPERRDYEYERAGVVNLFLFCEPLEGQRWVDVTERRTKADWAEQIKELVDERYPEAERIVLVMDNLNTHTPGSLYEAFEPKEAKRIAEKLEIHYTPKHGSWLNIAEIELQRAQPAVSGSTSTGFRDSAGGSASLAGATRRRGQPDRLALQHGGCAHQTQETLPFTSEVTTY
jgi:DDE superfamily endonuclease